MIARPTYEEAYKTTEKLARKLIHKMVPSHLKEEAFAECCLSLGSAVSNYNPDKDVAFGSYVYFYYRDAIFKTLKLTFNLSYSRDKYKKCLESMSNFSFVNVSDVETDLKYYSDTSNETKEVVSVLLSKLNKEERIVISQYYGIDCEPKSLTEVNTGKCKQRNSAIYRKAMEKLKDAS